jgi:hypothetical protein
VYLTKFFPIYIKRPLNDDTVLKKIKVFDRKGTEMPYGKTLYKQKQTVLHHSENGQWLSSVSNKIYITARCESYREFTINQFKELGVSIKDPIFFSIEKEIVLEKYLSENSYKKVFFLDDNDSNLCKMKKKLPHVECIRIDPLLYNKLCARTCRK